MKLLAASFAMGLSIALSFAAQGQQSNTVVINMDSLQKVRADSAQRVVMRDSLSLSDQTITQIFTLRDTAIQRVMRFSADNTLTARARNEAIRQARGEASDAIRLQMGELMYQRYLAMIVSK